MPAATFRTLIASKGVCFVSLACENQQYDEAPCAIGKWAQPGTNVHTADGDKGAEPTRQQEKTADRCGSEGLQSGVPRKFRRYLWGKSTDETKASNNRRGQHQHRLWGEIAWRWWLLSCIFGTGKFAKWHGSRVENHGMQPGPSTRSGCLGWATGCAKGLSKDQHCRCLLRRAVRRKVGKPKSIKSGDSDRSAWEHGRRKQASIAGLILDWRSNCFRNQAGLILDCMDWF